MLQIKDVLTESAIFKHGDKSNLANRGEGIPSNLTELTLRSLLKEKKIKSVLQVCHLHSEKLLKQLLPISNL